MPWNNGTARVVTVVCFLWMLSFPLLGGNSRGKDWLSSLAGHFVKDKKGGVPLILLAIPLLLAASVSALLTTTTTTITTTVVGSSHHHHHHHHHHKGSSRAGGDLNFDSLALVALFLPSLIYVVSNSYRKVHGENLTTSDQVLEIGNCCGMAAIAATSMLLVPVARQGPLWQALGWNPARAIRLHIWLGRIVVVSSMLHGFLHMIRWVYFEHETLRHNLIPPAICWTLREGTTNCDMVWPNCDCYTIWRNLSGFVAGTFMWVMAMTSLHPIRRQMYTIFYKSHILLAPIVILTVLMHYNRAILYFAPSLLYYIASSFPVLMEESRTTTMSCCGRSNGELSTDDIHILSATLLSGDCHDTPTLLSDSHNNSHKDSILQSLPQATLRPCVSLTFEASNAGWRRYAPGMHVHLLVPEISNLSHPFSVNRVISSKPKTASTMIREEDGTLNHENNEPQQPRQQLRIIFRVSGPFTKQLAARLTCASMNDTPLPRMKLQGYHGCTDRVAQVLQHDLVLIIAGGIGITAYLSLLEELTYILLDETAMSKMVTKKIVLHWMCREPALIYFIEKEYLEPLLRLAAASPRPPSSSAAYMRRRCHLELVVYQTGNNSNISRNEGEMTPPFCSIPPYSDAIHHQGAPDESDTREHTIRMDSEPTSGPNLVGGSVGVAFSPSRFSAASSIAGNSGRAVAFAATTWGGLFIIWSLYSNVQHSEQVCQRAFAPLAIVLLGLVVSFVINSVPKRILVSEDDNSPMIFGGRRHEGQWWDQVKIEEEEEENVADYEARDCTTRKQVQQQMLSPGIEMTELNGRTDGNEEEEEERKVEQLVTLQILNGRPDVENLLRSTSDAHRPAVFCCAPSSLVKEVYQRTHSTCRSSNVSFYSEAFEI